MRFAYRFGPLAAVGAALAVLIGLVSVSGAGNAPDIFAIDLDTAGNTATALGTRDECREVDPGDSVQIDLTIQNAPAANPMFAFAAVVEYDEAVVTVSAKENAGLLSTAPGYSELDAGDPIPDSDGRYSGSLVDVTAAGVSGSGFLQRLTIDISNSAAAGGYALSFAHDETGYVGPQSTEGIAPDALFGARLAVGVTCDSLPSPTAPPSNKQGDVDCTGGANAVSAVDALKVLRFVANLTVVQNDPCADIGTGGPPVQGDVDCSAGANPVNSVDALKILRFVASLSVIQNDPCVDIGT